MDIRAVITTGKIFERSNYFKTYYTCDIQINGEFQGDLYADTKQVLESLCVAICAIPELTKANEAYMSLHKAQSLSVADFTIKSEELEKLMTEAHEKLNGV